MSMSTNVQAFRDMNGEFARMLEAKKFCDERKLSYPKEVDEYFQGDADLDEHSLREQFLEVNISSAVTEYRDDYSEGYEVEVAKLPKDVKTIRFRNSW